MFDTESAPIILEWHLVGMVNKKRPIIVLFLSQTSLFMIFDIVLAKNNRDTLYNHHYDQVNIWKATVKAILPIP